MSDLSRFGVSLEEDLLAAFDISIGSEGYQNRSEAIRDLIRDHLIQKKVGQGDTEVIGVVTLVYDHRIHHLERRAGRHAAQSVGRGECQPAHSSR